MGSELRSVALLGLVLLLIAGCGDGGDGTTESSSEAGAAALGSGDEVTVAAAADIGMEADGRATLGAIGAAEPDVAVAFGDLSYAGPGSEQEFCDLAGSLVGEATPIELLAGIPSIIYGMLGLAIFVRAWEPVTSGRIFGATDSNGRTILSAALTLGLSSRLGSA